MGACPLAWPPLRLTIRSAPPPSPASPLQGCQLMLPKRARIARPIDVSADYEEQTGQIKSINCHLARTDIEEGPKSSFGYGGCLSSMHRGLTDRTWRRQELRNDRGTIERPTPYEGRTRRNPMPCPTNELRDPVASLMVGASSAGSNPRPPRRGRTRSTALPRPSRHVGLHPRGPHERCTVET